MGERWDDFILWWKNCKIWCCLDSVSPIKLDPYHVHKATEGSPTSWLCLLAKLYQIINIKLYDKSLNKVSLCVTYLGASIVEDHDAKKGIVTTSVMWQSFGFFTVRSVNWSGQRSTLSEGRNIFGLLQPVSSVSWCTLQINSGVRLCL